MSFTLRRIHTGMERLSTISRPVFNVRRKDRKELEVDKSHSEFPFYSALYIHLSFGIYTFFSLRETPFAFLFSNLEVATGYPSFVFKTIYFVSVRTVARCICRRLTVSRTATMLNLAQAQHPGCHLGQGVFPSLIHLVAKT